MYNNFSEDSIVFIDLEGQFPHFVEVSFIVWNTWNGMLNAHHFHINDLTSDHEAKFSHCISQEYVHRNGTTKTDLVEFVHKAFGNANVTFVGQGISDVIVFLQDYVGLVNVSVRDILLPNWIERDTEPSHQAIQKLKSQSSVITIFGASCPYKKAHSLKHVSPKRNRTGIIKKEHGAHCSLLDAAEVFLFWITKSERTTYPLQMAEFLAVLERTPSTFILSEFF